MLIKAIHDIRQGRASLAAGKVYDVPPEFGALAKALGWAGDPTPDDPIEAAIDAAQLGQIDAPAPPADGAVELAPQDGTHETSAD